MKDSLTSKFVFGVDILSLHDRVSTPEDNHGLDVKILQDRIQSLLTQLALQKNDNVKLQHANVKQKEQHCHTHAKLKKTTESLAVVTTSHAKRLSEKDALMSTNLTLERSNWKLRDSNANQLLMIRDSEAQVANLRAENRELRSQVSRLESETKDLKRKLEESEAGGLREKGRGSDGEYRALPNETREHTGFGDAYIPYNKQKRANRELRNARGEAKGGAERRNEERDYYKRDRHRAERSMSPKKPFGRDREDNYL